MKVLKRLNRLTVEMIIIILCCTKFVTTLAFLYVCLFFLAIEQFRRILTIYCTNKKSCWKKVLKMKLFGTYLLPLGVCAWSENESVLLRQRRLGYEWIAGYEPRTLITDHSAIDLDQLQMEMSLKSLNFDEFEAIYENGGHSMSIAKVILKNPKPPLRPIPANTVVLGTAVNGDVVTGVLLSELSWTTEDKEVLLLMQYAASDDQANHLRCQVGGLVKVLLGTIQDGCKKETSEIDNYRKHS